MKNEKNNPEMNTWIDPELEARVVAWVAGEASAFEVAELERLVAEKPELAIFKRRIEAVHGLVGKAARPDTAPLRMSAERRAKLLAAIGAAGEPEDAAPEQRRNVIVLGAERRKRMQRQRWIVGVAACAAFGVITVFRMESGFSSERRLAQTRRHDVSEMDLIQMPRIAPEEPAKQVAYSVVTNEYPQGKISPSLLERAKQETAVAVGGAAGQSAPARVFDAPAASSPNPVMFGAGGSIDAYNRYGFTRQVPAAPGTLSLGMDASAARDGNLAVGDLSAAAGLGELAKAGRFENEAVKFDALSTSGEKKADHLIASNDSVVRLDAFTVNADADVGFVGASSLAGGRIATALKDAAVGNSAVTTDFLSSFKNTTDGGNAGLAQNNLPAPAFDAPLGFVGGGGGGTQIMVDNTDAKPQVPSDKGLVASSSLAVGGMLTGLKDTPVAFNVITNEFSDSLRATAPGTSGQSQLPSPPPSSAPKFVAGGMFAGGQAGPQLKDPPPIAHGVRSEGFVSTFGGVKRTVAPAAEETATDKEPVSTFSLHVSDVSFRLAQANLAAVQRGEEPRAFEVRPEEFYNAFDYGDPSPATAEKVGARIEQSAHPFLQQRNLVRIALKVASTGRAVGQPLRLTVLLDTSGSMEREDRQAAVRRALEQLVALLGANDRVTLIGFARTPRLLGDNVPGNQAGSLVDLAKRTPPDGGTNLEAALKLGAELARRHHEAGAQNRIVVLTDGAANLGNADPAQLTKMVEELRQQGIAFDACGVGLEGVGDTVLEALTRKGDGRYYVLDSAEAADAGFARRLAGAFRPAAENVKVQVRFNPARVARYRLIGFEQHRLNEADFRNDQVDAAELAAEEAAVALYQVEPLPQGEGELGEVFMRFRDPATGSMVERSWTMTYEARTPAFERALPSMQLAGIAALLAEKLGDRPLAGQFKLGAFARVVNGLRAHYANQPRVQELVTMFTTMRRLSAE